MKTYEHQLSTALHALADQPDEPAAPISVLLRRGHRARRIRAAVLTTTMAAAVTAAEPLSR